MARDYTVRVVPGPRRARENARADRASRRPAGGAGRPRGGGGAGWAAPAAGWTERRAGRWASARPGSPRGTGPERAPSGPAATMRARVAAAAAATALRAEERRTPLATSAP